MPSSKTRGVKFGNFQPELSTQKEKIEESLPRTNPEGINSHSDQCEGIELDDVSTTTDTATHDETLRDAEAELAEMENLSGEFNGFESHREGHIFEIETGTATGTEIPSAEQHKSNSREASHSPSRQEQDIARRKRLQLKLKTFHGSGFETVSYE